MVFKGLTERQTERGEGTLRKHNGISHTERERGRERVHRRGKERECVCVCVCVHRKRERGRERETMGSFLISLWSVFFVPWQ